MTSFPGGNGFGPPPGAGGFGAPAAPLSSAQALAGLGGVDLESRMPFLPPGFQGRMKVARTYERNITKGNLGVCYFVEGAIVDITSPGGPEFWQGKKQDNLQLVPARVGGEYACRISGISSQGSAQAALREYRELLCALWAHRGLSQQYGKDRLIAAQAQGQAAVDAVQKEIAETFWKYGVMTAQYQAILDGRAQGDRAMAEAFAKEIDGRVIFVRTSVHVGQSGWGKLKHSFQADMTPVAK